MDKLNSRNDETNYRPVSILSNLSRVYEKRMFKEMEGYFDVFYQNANVVSEKASVHNIVQWYKQRNEKEN